MSEFKEGDDPKAHSVAETVEYLNGDITPDEYERVMNLEKNGKGRPGIVNLTGEEPPPEVTPEAPTVPPENAEAPPAAPEDPNQPDGAGPSEPLQPTINPAVEAAAGGKPVWYEETQGPIEEDKRDLYTVVPANQ